MLTLLESNFPPFWCGILYALDQRCGGRELSPDWSAPGSKSFHQACKEWASPFVRTSDS